MMVNDDHVPGLLSGSTGAAEASLYVRVEATASLRGGYRLGLWDGMGIPWPWRYIDRVRVADSGWSYMSSICLLYVFYMSSICLLLRKGTDLSVKFKSLSP